MKRPRKQFSELIVGPLKTSAETTLAWNWFRVGVRHGSGKRIPKTDSKYLQQIMRAVNAKWKPLKEQDKP